MDTSVFLIHVDATGVETYLPLQYTHAKSTFFLPDVELPELSVSRVQDAAHTNIKLDVETDHCLLTTFSNQPEPVVVLGSSYIEMPVSTATHHKSIILTEYHQFVTPTGGWRIEWDRSGAISNSMHSPMLSAGDMALNDELALPLVLITVEDEMTSSMNKDNRTSVPVTDIVLPPPESSESGENEHNTALAVHCNTPSPGRADLLSLGNEDNAQSGPESEATMARPPSASVDTDVGVNQFIDSEPESQQQIHNRNPKRRLKKIEPGINAIQRQEKRKKRAKAGAIEGEPYTIIDVSLDTVTPLIMSTDGFAAGDKTILEPTKATNQINKTSYAKSKSKATRIPAASLASGTTKSYQLRRSPRLKHEASLVESPTGLDFGRPKVVFSSTSVVARDKHMTSIIEKLGGSIITDVDDADVLCIGTGCLKKTIKFVVAVAKGKDIVTDDWVRQVCIDQKFSGRATFLPNNTKQEEEWGFSLSDAIERGKKGLKLLAGIHVYMTPQLCKDLGSLTRDFKHVVSTLTPSSIHLGLPKENSPGRILVIGSTKNVDPDSCEIGELGHRLYGQDLITMAVLRGVLESESAEFIIYTPIKKEPSIQ